jgi:DNA-binding beta-propeller fold protein YncE
VAYAAATGAQLWASRYAGTGGFNAASAVAVSPDGNTVFVTGGSDGTGSADDATVAYDAATGAQLWVSRFSGPLSSDFASSIAVSRAGGTVFVTGFTHDPDGEYWAATVAYNAATGAQLWASRFHGPGRRHTHASAVAVGPGGHTVYITGVSGGMTTRSDYLTVAYTAATGARRWARRYAGPAPGAAATWVAAGPGGRTIYVTGTSTGLTSGRDYATIAYNAATGARRWASRYNGPANRGDLAYAVAVSPGGRALYVTGASFGGVSSANDYATVAYNAATGTRLWARRYNGPGNGADQATSVAVSPTDGKVFVTGPSFRGAGQGLDYATIAYKG